MIFDALGSSEDDEVVEEAGEVLVGGGQRACPRTTLWISMMEHTAKYPDKGRFECAYLDMIV